MKKSPPLRPGLVLKRNYLMPHNMSAVDLADKMNVSYNIINNLLSGRGTITPDIALKLPNIFKETNAEYWINLQAAYDLWYAEGNRGTDEPFYELMRFENEAILKLVGAAKSIGYEAKAVVLKQKSLYPDIMAVPLDQQSDNERIFIEFQAYEDEMIRYTTASKVILSCAQDQYTGQVLSVIIYTDDTYQKKAKALAIESATGSSLIKGTFKEIVLSNMTENQLIEIDPRLVILAPFTLKPGTSKKELALKCHQWKTTALDVYTNSLKKNVLNVLSLFILNRFKEISVKEVRAMLNFDLSDTRAGEELMNIGRLEGQKKGRLEGRLEGRKEGQQEILYSLLCNRFGGNIPVQKEKIFSADTNVINSLTHSLFDFKTADDFALWWSKNSNSKSLGVE